MYVIYNHRTAAYTIAMAVVRRPGCRRTNVYFAVIYDFMFVIIMNATPDVDEAAVFAEDYIGEDDDWKDWASIF